MDYLALFSDDPTVAIDNPSLLHTSMCHVGTMSFVSLFEGSLTGSFAYAHSFKHIGPLLFTFRFNNYGDFDAYSEEEHYEGSFTASDYAFTVGYAMWLDSNFSIGATVKPVLSQYENYSAIAVAFDVAGSYVSDNRRFTASAMLRNMGAQMTTFDGTVEHIPFELSAALSYKLEKAPFRFFLSLDELQTWDLRYEDPFNPTTEVDPFTGEKKKEGWLEGMLDNLLRHMRIGVEFTIGRAFFARLGYSYRQSAEVQGYDAFDMSGISFGAGLRTRRFEFSFARRNYHLSQAPNFFTFSYRF